MVIGVLTLELSIDGAGSLKEKRMVLNRIKDRVQHSFNVSIAEIEGNELWNYACLGVAVVSNSQRHANQVLCKVRDLVETIRDCELDDCSMEFMHTT